LGSSSLKVLALGFGAIFFAQILNSFLCTYLFPFGVLISTTLYSLLFVIFPQIPPWISYLFVVPAFLVGSIVGKGKKVLWTIPAALFLFLATPMSLCFLVSYGIGVYSLKVYFREKRTPLLVLFILSFLPFFSPNLLTIDPFLFLFAIFSFQLLYSLVASFILFKR